MERFENPLDKILHLHKKATSVGIPSLCSANPFVLKAALKRLQHPEEFLLIEATCNQVNQYGGYSGKTPADFVRDIVELARQCDVSPRQIVLGGDHLGPYVWRNEDANSAMQKAKRLVQAYVEAGFTKIHIDASMLLGHETAKENLMERFAARTAELVAVAEETGRKLEKQASLRYVVGNEVPLPGGAVHSDNKIHVSDAEDTRQVIETTRQAFARLNLQDAWERVIAIVVQPGVEFGNEEVIEYDRSLARDLSELIGEYPTLVYEAHSTDYQTAAALKQMVEDHFAILKVGPALTFAFREAVFALAMIEAELSRSGKLASVSDVMGVLDRAMVQNPQFWQPYYPGDENQQAFARKYSLSDRCRYYWQVEDVQKALDMLFQNLERTPIPLSLLSQYLPVQYQHVRQGRLPIQPQALIMDRIHQVLEDYAFACTPGIG